MYEFVLALLFVRCRKSVKNLYQPCLVSSWSIRTFHVSSIGSRLLRMPLELLANPSLRRLIASSRNH